MLKLITCTPKTSMGELYYNAYNRKMEAVLGRGREPNVTEIMSLVLMGVKSYTRYKVKRESKELNYLLAKFKAMESLKGLMAQLTPTQFINTFPISKTYDGDRYECKDYFYTIKMINELDKDAPIGEGIDDFLWDYGNRDIKMFGVYLFSLMSDIMRAKGEPSIMERMSAEFGIPLYYEDKKNKELKGPIFVEKQDGSYYLNGSDAKIVSFGKSIPDYLRLIKGNSGSPIGQA